jgi:hypothetical protein
MGCSEYEHHIETDDSYTPKTEEAIIVGIKKRKVEVSKSAKTLFPSEPTDAEGKSNN